MKKIFLIVLIGFIFKIQAQVESLDSSFLPEQGRYILSGWVKEDHSSQVSHYNSYIKFSISGISLPVSVNLLPSGAVIDGWQRIVGVVEIPDTSMGSAPFLEISLECNNTSGGACYFDDIRFYPFNGNIKTFVYAEDTQRLMAELDENNYATFYEYDLEGGLIRVKKETERGVYTIQETRSNNPKKE